MTGMVSVPWWMAGLVLLGAWLSGAAVAVVGINWVAASLRGQAGAQGDGDEGR